MQITSKQHNKNIYFKGFGLGAKNDITLIKNDFNRQIRLQCDNEDFV